MTRLTWGGKQSRGKVAGRSQQKRGKENAGLSISILVMFMMICQLLYKLFPCVLLSLNVSCIFFLLQGASSLCSTQSIPDNCLQTTRSPDRGEPVKTNPHEQKTGPTLTRSQTVTTTSIEMILLKCNTK